MKRIVICGVILLFVGAASAQDRPFGTFVGDVKTKWLPDGRGMELLEDFSYVDQRYTVWDAPKGWVIDGASIPRFAWSLIGGPYDQKYRNASVIHDVACDRRSRRWEDVHEAFYNAMRAAEVTTLHARTMYAAVYHFGPRWAFTVTQYVPQNEVGAATDTLRAQVDRRSALAVSVEEHYVKGVGVSGRLENIPTGLKKVSVTVSPPPTDMTREGLDQLRQAIVDQNLGLEQIRNFVPK
jgi:hypothetical protein